MVHPWEEQKGTGRCLILSVEQTEMHLGVWIFLFFPFLFFDDTNLGSTLYSVSFWAHER